MQPGLPGMPGGGGRGDDRRLLRLYRSLGRDDRRTLLAFAEFLAARQGEGAAAGVPEEPRPEPRPEGESVVAAIKRLSRTYPMIARETGMLNEVSTLVAGHVLHGRPPAQVIDDLETVFARAYEAHRRGGQQAS